MKIAFITNTFYPEINGVVTSIINSSKELSKKKHEIIIFTTKHKEKINLDKNIKIKEYRCTGLLTRYPDFKIELLSLKFLKDLKKFKPDIIHVHTPTPFAFESLYYSKKNKIPIIGTYHTIAPDFLKHSKIKFLGKLNFAKRLMWRYTNLFYNKCDLITTPSKEMIGVLKKNGIKNKILYLSNGLDIDLFRKSKFNKIPVFLYSGRLSYEKNIDIVIKAFKILQDKNIKAKLILIGSGPEENKLKNLSKGYNIEFLGAMNREKLADYYSKSDVYITASTVETEGITILEAMASSLPIIGVNKLAVPNLVKQDKNGFIIEPYNINDMEINMEKLAKNINLRKKFGSESAKLVKEYSLKKIINQLEKIYFSLL